MAAFTVEIDNAKINKQITDAVKERIDQEKNSIINKTVRELFEAPTFFNKTGGPMYQSLREQIETLAIEAVAGLDVEKIRADFNEQFTKFYNEHLPVAVERAARKAAYQTAEREANVKVKGNA